jgi:phosphoribosylamine--glycine ligase
MRILIVGNGGREHALLWKLRRDAPTAQFFATQPNGGMAPLCTAVPIAPTDVVALSGWAASQRIDLTVVGPEAPLAAGIVDRFEANGLPTFGPTRDAARIEASKAYSKELMRSAGIPTAEHRTFRDQGAAEDYVRERGAPIVIKASGLAAGKGAVVCATVEEATDTIASMLGDLAFGEAGREVVVEDFMEGEELFVFAVADGERSVLLLASQDHKRVGEGDTGPNTGGMGAYAPVSIATRELLAEADERVFGPTLRALVEFNCRFGDPETQVVLPLMDSSLLELLATVAEGGSLAGKTARFKNAAAVSTVVASGGYPGSYEKGKRIELGDATKHEDVTVFHAGTAHNGDHLATSGGRVLAVTASGESFGAAADRSREAASAVHFEGAFFRKDIGWRERNRGQGT